MTGKSFIGLRWFQNLAIQRKQLLGLFTSEVISIVGLVGVGAGLIVAGGRSLLENQAKSELAVAEINYNIKIDQMGFGFRGQSDNAAIIAAAKTHDTAKSIDDSLRAQVKQILQNEIEARKIEYATLVGRDLRIIVSANADRAGERFNPNNLVAEVLYNPQQIKTSERVDLEELQKESPPLPNGAKNRDALVRYTVTPVKDPDTQRVLGALVSGDIANGKPQMAVRTLAAQNGGYSAVYMYRPAGEFSLVTAARAIEEERRQETSKPAKEERLPENGSHQEYTLDVPLTDLSLLRRAVANPEKIVTQRVKLGGRAYTIAAKQISNFAGQPVAILVRGTSESALNTLLGNSLLLQALVAILALAVDVALAIALGRAIAPTHQTLAKNNPGLCGGAPPRASRSELHGRSGRTSPPV